MTSSAEASTGRLPLTQRLQGWIRSEAFCHFHLALLFALILVQPLQGRPFYDRFLADVMLLAVMISGVVAVGRKRWRVITASALALPISALALLDPVDLGTEWLALALVTAGLFMAFCTVCLLTDLFQLRRVRAGSVSAALCAYIMLGLTWAFAYALLDRLDPSAIEGLRHVAEEAGSASGRLGQFVYFSLITMTTVGFGDITPKSDVARTLVELEALIGQIVLVVLIARLVGLQVASAMLSNTPADQ